MYQLDDMLYMKKDKGSIKRGELVKIRGLRHYRDNYNGVVTFKINIRSIQTGTLDTIRGAKTAQKYLSSTDTLTDRDIIKIVDEQLKQEITQIKVPSLSYTVQFQDTVVRVGCKRITIGDFQKIVEQFNKVYGG